MLQMPCNERDTSKTAPDQAAPLPSLDGPHVLIDGVAIEANRTTLSPAEVARVLRIEDADVRNMLRRGELSDISCDGRRRLDPDEVIAAVERRVHDGQLGAHVFVELAALIAGRL
jgi:hypothetical protein